MISVLFAREDSIYKTFPDVDVWDIDRDATQWPGGNPVIAHPPCRAWGRLRQQARPREDEAQLVAFAIRAVRRFGGVLEHPEASLAFRKFGLPYPGQTDAWNGWTISIPQFWWGHKENKPTWLYICGCKSQNIPPIPLIMGDAPCVVNSSKKRERPEFSKADRERTPEEFAKWLVDLASRCSMEGI